MNWLKDMSGNGVTAGSHRELPAEILKEERHSGAEKERRSGCKMNF